MGRLGEDRGLSGFPQSLIAYQFNSHRAVFPPRLVYP